MLAYNWVTFFRASSDKEKNFCAIEAKGSDSNAMAFAPVIIHIYKSMIQSRIIEISR